MNQQPKESPLLSQLLFACYLLFFISLVFSFRAVSSISTGLLVVTGFIYNKNQYGSFFHKNTSNIFLLSCLLYFLLLLLSFSFGDSSAEARRQLLLKTGLLLVPLAVCASGYVSNNTRTKLLTAYTIVLISGCLFCLAMAFRHFANTGEQSHFFYHPLVSPLKQHAVYFSLLVFFALLFLLEKAKIRQWLLSPVLHFSLVPFLAFFLVLLSSKLVIIFFAFYLLYYFITLRNSFTHSKTVTTVFISCLVLAGILLFTTRNPVSNRFNEIKQGDMAVLSKDSYQPGAYFNGLQFRLLQWKLVPEILHEQNGWWTGVGAGKAQPLLAQKYISKNMYGGKPGSQDHGYLLYNTHNQFLESLLKNGIPGVLLFLFICFALLRMAWQKKSRVVSFTIILLLLYCFSESILETQYGLLIFTFFPLFFSQD